MKKVAVVILNWNGRLLLEQFLPSVINHTDPNIAEIIIADNASTDDSIPFVQTNYPTLQIIQLAENYGFAQGYNEALAKIDSTYYVLLNSDVEVSPNWLPPIIHFMEQTPEVAAVQPKILSQKNKTRFEYAGAAGGFIDNLGYPFCRGRIFSTVEKDSGQYDTPIPIFWVSGACMVIRSKDYKEAGGLDPSFFAHMEEIDLCWRLNARGRTLFCLPQSEVYHVGGATLAEESPHKTFLNFRNNILMLYKNLSEKEFKKRYKKRILLDYIAALQMFISGKKENAKAILKAHKEFRNIKYNYTSLQNQNIQQQTVEKIKPIYSSSILAAYYLKGKKYFNLLNW